MTHPILACAAFVALLASAAEAGTLKVPKDFATIQAAVNAAVPGDTIVVSKGTYAPFTVAGTNAITVKGKGKPVIDGGGALQAGVAIMACADIALRGLVVRNAGDRGIEVTGSTTCTISKCRVEDIGGVGINLGGAGHFLEKNKILNTGSEAINIDDAALNIVMEKNRMTDTDGAITFRGGGHTASKNIVKDSRNEGFNIVAQNCFIEKNTFDGVVDDALDVESDNNFISSNTIKNVGSNGVEVSPAAGAPFPVTSNVFEKNHVTNAADNGYFIDTAGNEFTGNTAKLSGNFGLLDEAGAGANVYQDNKFGTEQIN